MRITQKGQITIPKPVREQAGVDMQTELDVTFRDGVIVIEKVKDSDVVARRRMREFDDWLEKVHGTGSSGLTADEILEMTRGPFDDVDSR